MSIILMIELLRIGFTFIFKLGGWMRTFRRRESIS